MGQCYSFGSISGVLMRGFQFIDNNYSVSVVWYKVCTYIIGFSDVISLLFITMTK